MGAIEWFHHRADRELLDVYETVREYYREDRRETAETFDEQRARPPWSAPRQPARPQPRLPGHHPTGLFGERDDCNLSAICSGRYVLAYLDANGRILEANEIPCTSVDNAESAGAQPRLDCAYSQQLPEIRKGRRQATGAEDGPTVRGYQAEGGMGVSTNPREASGLDPEAVHPLVSSVSIRRT